MNLLAEYHNIIALEDSEMVCTKVAEHKIEVTDPRPFKERPMNISSGLLDEVAFSFLKSMQNQSPPTFL